MIIVDTSVWIDFFKKYASPESRYFEQLIMDGDLFFLTELIVMELLNGIRSEPEHQKTLDHLLSLPILKPTGLSTYLRASDIFRSCARRGYGHISISDCLISAMAIETGFSVLTRDADFKTLAKLIPDLHLIVA